MLSTQLENGHSCPDVAWWGWVAGMIDGEGSISIFKTGGISGRKWPSDCLVLRVGNKSRAALEKLCEVTTKGSISQLGPSLSRKYGPYYEWNAGPKASAEILEQCLPWLVIKRPQAQLALQYYNIVRMSPGSVVGVRGRLKVPVELREKREALRLELQKVNYASNPRQSRR